MDTVESRDRALFDHIAADYVRKDELPSMVPARRYRVESLVTRHPQLGTVLDVACGSGAQAMYLAGHYTRYIGVDHSAALIAYAQDRYGRLPHTTFIAANVKAITTAAIGGSVDTILMIGGLHHITDRLPVLRHVLALARSGAWFFCLEPSAGNPLVQLLRHIRQRVDKAYSDDQTQFNPEALRALLIEAGLQHVTLRRHGWFSPPFAQINLRSTSASRAGVALDRVCERFQLPGAWNVMASGVVP